MIFIVRISKGLIPVPNAAFIALLIRKTSLNWLVMKIVEILTYKGVFNAFFRIDRYNTTRSKNWRPK